MGEAVSDEYLRKLFLSQVPETRSLIEMGRFMVERFVTEGVGAQMCRSEVATKATPSCPVSPSAVRYQEVPRDGPVIQVTFPRLAGTAHVVGSLEILPPARRGSWAWLLSL